MPSLVVNLAPLPVPTHFAIQHKPGRRQDGFQVAQVKITDLSRETIDEMCEELRLDMLKAAGHIIDKDSWRRDEPQSDEVVPGGQEALNRR